MVGETGSRDNIAVISEEMHVMPIVGNCLLDVRNALSYAALLRLRK